MGDTWQQAKKMYCRDKTMTLKKVAEKYRLSVGEVRKRSAKEGWYRLRREGEKTAPEPPLPEMLSQSRKINEIAEKLLENIRLSCEQTDKPTSIYNLTSALKSLTAILRDVNDLPSLKDRQSYELSKVKLELAKIKSEQTDETEAGGVVVLPEVAAAEPMSEDVSLMKTSC